MKRSWRCECAEIWRAIAEKRAAERSPIGQVAQALANHDILLAAENIATHQPGANYR